MMKFYLFLLLVSFGGGHTLVGMDAPETPENGAVPTFFTLPSNPTIEDCNQSQIASMSYANNVLSQYNRLIDSINTFFPEYFRIDSAWYNNKINKECRAHFNAQTNRIHTLFGHSTVPQSNAKHKAKIAKLKKDLSIQNNIMLSTDERNEDLEEEIKSLRTEYPKKCGTYFAIGLLAGTINGINHTNVQQARITKEYKASIALAQEAEKNKYDNMLQQENNNHENKIKLLQETEKQKYENMLQQKNNEYEDRIALLQETEKKKYNETLNAKDRTISQVESEALFYKHLSMGLAVPVCAGIVYMGYKKWLE